MSTSTFKFSCVICSSTGFDAETDYLVGTFSPDVVLVLLVYTRVCGYYVKYPVSISNPDLVHVLSLQ